jgi:hypothetical protein
MDTSEIIRHMVDDILADRGSDAMDKYNTAINVKLADAIDDRKKEIASSLGRENEEV